jgi:hypothetical protein
MSRRFTTALLWLAIALLPVRGLAAALMPIGLLGEQTSSSGSNVVEARSVAAMPCHGDAAQQTPASHNCALCDLCHGGVAQAPAPLVLPAAPLSSRPRATATTPIAPRAPDGVFRPPRTALAS